MDGTFVHLLLLKFSMGSDNFKWKNKAKKIKRARFNESFRKPCTGVISTVLCFTLFFQIKLKLLSHFKAKFA